MIKVHHLENSQSLRVLWLLEELGVKYEFVYYQRDKVTSLAPANYKALHPAGTAPVISDGPLVMAETNAIIDYILDKYPDSSLRPAPGQPAYPHYLYWFHAAQGSLMPLLLDMLIFQRMVDNMPFFLRPLMRGVTGKVKALFHQPRLDALLGSINTRLGEHTWLSGEELTAADIVMGYCLEVSSMRFDFEELYPNIPRFLTQMRERPAYKAAIAKGGPLRPFGKS